MAGQRRGRPTCIRAAFSTTWAGTGFRKKQRNARRPLQVCHRRKCMDFFAEAIWRELLGPDDGNAEEALSLSGPLAGWLWGAGHGHLPSHTPRPKRTEDVGAQDPFSARERGLAVTRASWEACDVDMLPAGGGQTLPEASGSLCGAGGPATGVTATPEDPSTPTELPEGGPHLPARARHTRLPSRLGSEEGRGPQRPLSKRKLELLLAEPDKNKRKKKCHGA